MNAANNPSQDPVIKGSVSYDRVADVVAGEPDSEEVEEGD